MILQVLYLLHDGRMSVAQGVFPLVGKMINVARMMGLAVDPDDFSGGLYSLFEAETRRRVWWDVFYYDLFVSDCMGHPPTIADNTFTTRLPAEVDDDQFNPSSTTLPSPPGGEGSEKGTAYFVLKCRLAQLVKNVKKQTFRDPLDDDPGELSMEQAATYESSVITFLNKLPEAFRLDMNSDAAQLTSASFSVSPFLVAQRCELVILAHRVILKLYLPFLKEASLNKPHQAFFGTINAAHAIIYASRVMHLIWQDTRPAAFDFYDFSRTLFDAAVVCAHAVIQQPKNMLAGEAMKSVGFAADILRQLGAACSGVEGSRGERSKTEAIRIVEIMKNKAETARTRNANGAAVGVKRKHSEVESEGERLSGDFRLPFVGAAVASRAEPTKSVPHSKAAPAKDTPPQEPKPRNDNKRLKEKDDKREKDKSKEKDKDKEKDKTKYPSVGIRIRPGHVPPAIRQRGSSTATSVSSGSVPSGRINSSTPGVGPTAAPSHTQAPAAQPPAPTVPPPPHTSTYTDFLPPQPQRHGSSSGFEPVHSNDYPVQYSAPDDSLDRRRYSSQPYAEAPQAPVYAQQAPSTSYPPSSAHSPTAYTNGPSPSNYYIYTSPAPSSGYDSSGALSHSHSMSMAEAVAPSPITTGSTRGSMGPPMSTPSHDQPYPYNAPAGKDLGVSPQTGHEFQQAAPALALPSPHMQQWQSTEQASAYANWPEYTKYYSG
ncbi:hypothetical protein OBBRIDRAFT_757687 [Obba rivulosa]|uniref:Xylanolytic transcriptional activator regulatory domain-containing protein n=1 Tax=Obba rivulosa TaxID=1052685 RepID=A0A8E2AV83_9APHY|nr:hypothetical protein OBBRIDRAFT_757687 [Obba rivulosa]